MSAVETEFMRRLTDRVNQRTAPFVNLFGDDAPVVKMALNVLEDAKEIAAELGTRRISTAEAVAQTGWHSETLQRWARAKLDGGTLPDAWAALDVEETTTGFFFVVSSIPANPRASE